MTARKHLRQIRWLLTGGATRRRLRQRIVKLETEMRQEHVLRKKLRIEKHELLVRAEQAESQLRKLIAAGQEPGRTGCDKERFHREAEATEWLELIATRTGQPEDWLRVYPCTTCPASPLTGRRYLHVGHVDPEVKKVADRIHQGPRGRDAGVYALASQLDPAVVERLRAMRDGQTG